MPARSRLAGGSGARRQTGRYILKTGKLAYRPEASAVWPKRESATLLNHLIDHGEPRREKSLLI